MRRIYLDHAASTPMLPEAFEAMRPWLEREFGNASSLHLEGRRARLALDEARESLSEALGCLFAEVIFTGSGTEAAVLAIVGAALANRDSSRNRIILGAAEHPCVLQTSRLLEKLGYRVERVGVDRQARIDLEDLQARLGPDVLLVSVMHANNELGTLNPTSTVAELAHEHGALMHADAVQSFRALHWSVRELGADLVSVSGHKVGGPKGVGALYVQAGVKIEPLLAGGGQERELRGGTENVPAIIGFGAAVRARPLPGMEARDRFVRCLSELSEPAWSVSSWSNVLPGHAHLRFPGHEAETLLIRLDREGVAAGSGSACSSGSLEPSHVLLAAGYTETEAREGLRFTFGPSSTVEEAEDAARVLASLVEGAGSP
ncbi:MAG TPA: cysteine desulfurase family protein [Fimbriimonadaceae bacterium]|nr:cysteine desulfurase family protein [Fimbriimonadaceae bacterium]